jgi:TorA maturation chaperone TorD
MRIEERSASQSAGDDLARECLYRFLSAVAAGPYSAAWEKAFGTENQNLALQASRWLALDNKEFDIPHLVEELQASPDALRADYDRVFGLVGSKECPPYETEYYPAQETFGRSQQIADVAGFYRAFGIEPSQTSPERPDHLGLELEFMAFLLLKKRLAISTGDLDLERSEQASVCERAHREFLRDHLAWWVPAFAAGLGRRAEDGYPRVLSDVLAAWISAECRRLDISSVLMPVRPELAEGPDEQSSCAACPLHL